MCNYVVMGLRVCYCVMSHLGLGIIGFPVGIQQSRVGCVEIWQVLLNLTITHVQSDLDIRKT